MIRPIVNDKAAINPEANAIVTIGIERDAAVIGENLSRPAHSKRVSSGCVIGAIVVVDDVDLSINPTGNQGAQCRCSGGAIWAWNSGGCQAGTARLVVEHLSEQAALGGGCGGIGTGCTDALVPGLEVEGGTAVVVGGRHKTQRITAVEQQGIDRGQIGRHGGPAGATGELELPAAIAAVHLGKGDRLGDRAVEVHDG